MASPDAHADRLAETAALAATWPAPLTGERRCAAPPQSRHGRLHLRLLDAAAVAECLATYEQVFYVRMLKERFALDLVSLLAEAAPGSWEAVRLSRDCERYRAVAEYREALLAAGSAHEQALAAQLDQAAGPGGVPALGAELWHRTNALLDEFMALLARHTLNAPYLTR